MTLRPLLLALAVTAALAGCDRAPSTDTATPAAPAASAQNPAEKATQLKQIYADYWEANLKLNPVMATFTGDPRAYRLRGTTIALRREQSDRVLVKALGLSEPQRVEGLAVEGGH